MKIIRFISLGILLSFLFACAPSTEQAMKYNDKLTEQQTLISKKIEDLNDTYDNYIAEEMNAAYKSAIKQVEESTKAVKKIKPFDDEKVFKKAILESFAVYKSIIENEHARIIELYVLPDDEYGKSEIKEIEELRNKAVNKVDKEADKLVKDQQEFAKKYEIVIAAE